VLLLETPHPVRFDPNSSLRRQHLVVRGLCLRVCRRAVRVLSVR